MCFRMQVNAFAFKCISKKINEKRFCVLYSRSVDRNSKNLLLTNQIHIELLRQLFPIYSLTYIIKSYSEV